jgi:Protein of unknown function (DUF2490)
VAAPYSALVSALLLSTAASAQVWTWHAVDVALPAGRSDIVLHARPGTSRGRFAYLRTGAWLRTPVHKRIEVAGGYLYTTDNDPSGWDGSSRLFTSAEVSAGTLRFRTTVERFFPESSRDYFRYRQRAMFAMRRRITPVLVLEMFFDRHGVSGTRPSAGVRWRVNAWSSLEAGYFYDARAARAGGVRHVIFTGLTIRPWGR